MCDCKFEREKDSSNCDFDDEVNKWENNDNNADFKEEMPRISLAAITSITQQQTLKLRWIVKKENVIVLIDKMSTHNFIDVFVKILNLFVYL